MPNIKSQIKRDAQNKARQAKNKAEKSALKTAIKKFDAAVAASTYKCAVSAVDHAAGKNLIHKNNAANKKSAMDKKLNTLA